MIKTQNPPTCLGDTQSSIALKALEAGAQDQGVSRYPRTPQGDYEVDGAIDTHHLKKNWRPGV